MTCTTCRDPHRLAWRSTVTGPNGTRSATLCAGCRGPWRARMLAGLCDADRLAYYAACERAGVDG